MALDLGLTTHHLLSAMDGVVDDAIDRAMAVPAADTAFRTAAVGRSPYISAALAPRACSAAARRRRFPTTGRPSPWTAPIST